MSQVSRSYQSAALNTSITEGTGRRLVGRDLHADALVMLEREQVIDDLEALLALGVVDAAEIDQLLELALRLVAQVAQHALDRAGLHAERQLAAHQGGVEQNVAERRRDLLEEVAQGFFALGQGHDRHGAARLARGAGAREAQRSIVPVRWILRCSRRMP